MFLAVNVSPVTAERPELLTLLGGCPVDEVVLEVTEHAQVEDYRRFRVAIDARAPLGASLAVDDAGAGFSSLRHILELDAELIKLDGSLTRSLEDRPAPPLARVGPDRVRPRERRLRPRRAHRVGAPADRAAPPGRPLRPGLPPGPPAAPARRGGLVPALGGAPRRVHVPVERKAHDPAVLERPQRGRVGAHVGAALLPARRRCGSSPAPCRRSRRTRSGSQRKSVQALSVERHVSHIAGRSRVTLVWCGQSTISKSMSGSKSSTCREVAPRPALVDATDDLDVLLGHRGRVSRIRRRGQANRPPAR